MSVNRNDYVMLAADIKDKHIDFWEDDKYIPYVEGHKNCALSIICDYMSDRYCFFGKVLKKASDYDGLDRTPINIDETAIMNIKRQIIDEYYKLFNEHIVLDDIKLYCFTQWS